MNIVDILIKAAFKGAAAYTRLKAAEAEKQQQASAAKPAEAPKPKAEETVAETPKAEPVKAKSAEVIPLQKKEQPIPEPVKRPQLKMTMQEAQRAGFQFRYSRRSGNAVITSIHIKSDTLVIPAYIDGHAVTVIDKGCRCIIEPHVQDVRLYFPDTVDLIGDNAFCVMLAEGYYRPTSWQPVFSEVFFPEFINIGSKAFFKQNNIRQLHFGRGTYIMEGAFALCTGLKEVDLEGCRLSDYAFNGCRNLKKVTGEFSGDAYASGTFADTPYAREKEFVIVGKSLQKYNGHDMIVTVPDGIEYIGALAFSRNKEMRKVLLPASVKAVGEYAFSGCEKLSKINLSNVQRIDRLAFAGCRDLTCVKLADEVSIKSSSFSDTAFEKSCIEGNKTIINGTLTSLKHDHDIETVVIPQNVRVIADNIMYITGHTVIFPESVKRIDNISQFSYADKLIFRNPDVRVLSTERAIKTYINYTMKAVCFEINGRMSEFPMYFPKYYGDDSVRSKIYEFYNSFFEGMNIEFYDSGVLKLGLNLRQQLETAYKRLKGGFKLTDANRQMYEQFVRVHRKKGLEFAVESGDDDQIKFFEALLNC